METIVSKKGQLTWTVIRHEMKKCGQQLRAHFTVACSECGYEKNGLKSNLEKIVSCPGCSKKPTALKTDDTGACISVCDIVLVEFVRSYQEQHGVSERAAVRQFIDTAKAAPPPRRRSRA